MELVKEELENSMKGEEKKDQESSDDDENHKDPTPQSIGAMMKSQEEDNEAKAKE
jgi:hypothetical protein